MHSSKKQKVVSFYGKATPRPTVLLDKNNEPVRDRVDAPEPVTGALIEWAKAVPESRGGARPVFKNAPRACLTAFGALVQQKRKELQQGEMHNYYSSEARSLQLDARKAALQDWKLFSDADKAVYQAQADDDQERWEAEVEEYEKRFPYYRSHLAQKHKNKLNDKGAIDIKLTQLGIKKPCTARHFFIKEQVEKRLKENEALALEFTATELFEAASLAKGQAWTDMAPAGKKKYEELATEDKDRFQAQLQGHPKLQHMIKAYEQKQQELKAIKAAKKAPSKAPKKRKRTTKESAVTNTEAADQPETPADQEAADNQQAFEGQADDADMEEAQPQIRMSADVGKVNAVAAVPTQEEAPDEPVSDTDEDIADHVLEPEDPVETVAETQNDEEQLTTAGSQGSTVKKRLGIGQFRSFFAGLFTARKSAGKPNSQATQDSMTDDLPPLQNTLGSQPEAAGAQQSLADMLQDVADMDAADAATGAVPSAETADAGVALVTQPESFSQVAPTQVIPEEEAPPSQETVLATAASNPTDSANVSSTTADKLSRVMDDNHVAAADVTDAPTQDTVLGKAGKAKDIQAEEQLAASHTDAPAAAQRGSSAANKDNSPGQGTRRTSPRAGADSDKPARATPRPVPGPSSPARASPAAQSVSKSASKAQIITANGTVDKKGISSLDRDALIGRRIRKEFETDSGLKAFTGWIIGLHNNRKWYAVQYEDGDTEEFLVSELKSKKKKLLQPAGPQDSTDYDELERLYAAAKVQWAKEEEEQAEADDKE